MQNGLALQDAASRSPIAATAEGSDLVLVIAIAAGDRLAMQTLFARHNVRVYRFVLRLVGNAAVAEDVVNDVFLDVWRQAGRFEARSQVSTWLLSIARNKALSILRNRSIDQLDDAVAAQIEDPAEDPEAALVRKDRSALIRACLTRLSPAHREIIDLVYYHDKSIAEVADIIAAPQNTVKTRMFYARKRLAELFEAEGLDNVLS